MSVIVLISISMNTLFDRIELSSRKKRAMDTSPHVISFFIELHAEFKFPLPSDRNEFGAPYRYNITNEFWLKNRRVLVRCVAIN